MGVNQKGVFDTDVNGPYPNASSWSNVDKTIPVMIVTGDGDNHCEDRFLCGGGDSPSRRTAAYHRMSPDGNKYMMFVNDSNSSGGVVSAHEVFSHDITKCVDGYPGQCDDTISWIESTVLAFFDTYVLKNTTAAKWLKSGKLSSASNGIATIQSK
jgi:hypothetical protein